MGRTWVAGVAAMLCLVLGGGVVAASTPLGFNISVNSGAEGGPGGKGGKVPIPLWKTTSTMTAVKYGAPGFPSKDVAEASKGETNFFYCGRNTAGSEARQRIRISGRNGLIDGGGLSLKLTVRIGSHSHDGDSGRMVVRYLNGAGGAISELATQSVAATGGQLPRIKTSGAVPAGTRSLLVVLEGMAAAGPDCDVFFDNVSVKLVHGAP